MNERRSPSPAPGPLLALAFVLVACQAPAPGAAPARATPAAAGAPSAGAPAPAAPAAQPTTSHQAAARWEAARLPERTRVVFAVTPGIASAAYVAMERGYFADVNIDLELEDLHSASELVGHLVSGSVDIGGTAASPGLFNAIARGLPIKAVLDLNHFAPAGKSHQILARQELYDSGQLRSVEQLKGRRVATNTVPGGLVIDLDRALHRVGLSIDDVDLVQMPFGEQPAALANGSVDAGIMVEPLASRATERNVATPIRYLNEDYPNHQVSFTKIGTRLRERPEVMRAFAVAWLRGARDFERARERGEDIEAIAAIISKYNRLEPTVIAALLRNGGMQATDPNGHLYLESIQYDLHWYRGRGYVERDLNVAEFVDMHYADYAVGLLGPYR